MQTLQMNSGQHFPLEDEWWLNPNLRPTSGKEKNLSRFKESFPKIGSNSLNPTMPTLCTHTNLAYSGLVWQLWLTLKENIKTRIVRNSSLGIRLFSTHKLAQYKNQYLYTTQINIHLQEAPAVSEKAAEEVAQLLKYSHTLECNCKTFFHSKSSPES